MWSDFRPKSLGGRITKRMADFNTLILESGLKDIEFLVLILHGLIFTLIPLAVDQTNSCFCLSRKKWAAVLNSLLSLELHLIIIQLSLTPMCEVGTYTIKIRECVALSSSI